MENLADLLFEAKMLKEIPRSGFQFLGAGRESVAEHVYMMTLHPRHIYTYILMYMYIYIIIHIHTYIVVHVSLVE